MNAITLALLFASHAWGYPSAPMAGTTGASFLKIGVGARPMAMSGAYAAASEGVYSLYWNPAGLTRMKDRGEAVFFNNRWLGLIEHQFAAGAFRAGEGGPVLALGLTRLGTKQKGYDAADVPTGDFATSDLALSLGAAGRWEAFPERYFDDDRGISGGAAIKLIHQSVPSAKATGWAADCGAQAALFGDDHGALSAGLAVLNLGPAMGLGQASPLPRDVRLGAAYLRRQVGLLGSIEVSKPADERLVWKLGTEWRVMSALSLRAGYRVGKPSSGLMDALTFGGGVSWKSLELGGAFVGHPDLGGSVLMDLKFRW